MWNKKNFSTDNAPVYALFQDFSNLIDLGVRTLGQVCVVVFDQKVEKQRFFGIRKTCCKSKPVVEDGIRGMILPERRINPS